MWFFYCSIRYTLDIEAVSCDEMYVDCTSLLNDIKLSPMEFATILREEIRKKTNCTCSTGFGENRLQVLFFLIIHVILINQRLFVFNLPHMILKYLIVVIRHVWQQRKQNQMVNSI